MFVRTLQIPLLFAQNEATQARAAEVRPGHLLLGLLRVAPGKAVARLLQNITIEQARAALAPEPASAATSRPQQIPNSAETERLIRLAVDEARVLGQPLTTEHLLLALFEDAECAHVLAAAGLLHTTVRDRLTRRAQKPVEIVVGTSPDAALALSAFDPALHPQFARALTQPRFDGMGPIACVVANTSLEHVKALVARWTFTDQDGDTRIDYVVVDDYFIYNRFQVLTPGRSVLVTPSGVEPKSSEPNFCYTGPVTVTDVVPVRARLDIDSAVFERGRVSRIVGSDTFHIEAYIHGRYAAAMALVDEAHRTGKAGRHQETAPHLDLRKVFIKRPPHNGKYWVLPTGGPWLMQLRALTTPPTFER